MAVKKKTEKQTSSWIGEVEKYSRQIWLAGLGAYSKVSKDGTKLFDTLVKDGEKAEKQAKSEVDKQVGAVKAGVGVGSGGGAPTVFATRKSMDKPSRRSAKSQPPRVIMSLRLRRRRL